MLPGRSFTPTLGIPHHRHATLERVCVLIIHIHIRIHIHIHTYIYIYMCVYICICMYVYIYIHGEREKNIYVCNGWLSESSHLRIPSKIRNTNFLTLQYSHVAGLIHPLFCFYLSTHRFQMDWISCISHGKEKIHKLTGSPLDSLESFGSLPQSCRQQTSAPRVYGPKSGIPKSFWKLRPR